LAKLIPGSGSAYPTLQDNDVESAEAYFQAILFSTFAQQLFFFVLANSTEISGGLS
jgi:hypothetical protein